uniref:Uncharacterized protein n=1 Tax=Romanomermis culicivorax TaxID=13658 RepID=A0A915JFS0_ROMCU
MNDTESDFINFLTKIVKIACDLDDSEFIAVPPFVRLRHPWANCCMGLKKRFLTRRSMSLYSHILVQLSLIDRDLHAIWLAKEVEHFSSIFDVSIKDAIRILPLA